MNFLLDTNAFVDHLRLGPRSQVTARLLATPAGGVFLSAVVLGELVYGAIRSGPAKGAANRALVAGLARRYKVLPFDADCAEEYGKVRAHLAATVQMIGANDLLIAALAHNLTLVTHNAAEFGRVPGLALDDWQ